MKVIVRVDQGTEWTFTQSSVRVTAHLLIVTNTEGKHTFPLAHVLWWSEKE